MKDTRTVIEEALGDRLRESEYEDLAEEGFLDIGSAEPGAVNRAVNAIRQKREASLRSPPGPTTRVRRFSGAGRFPTGRSRSEIDWHEEALSDVLAIHAGQEPSEIRNAEDRALVRSLGVAAFRHEVLGGQLVSLEQIGAWIQDMVKREGPARRSARLAYGVPWSPRVQHERARYGGTLDRLRKISERLAMFYGWDTSQATVFVLTGVTPRLDVARAHVQCSDPLPARSRISLTIDPKMAPQEVADYYRAVRSEVFGKRRFRRLSEKHARLSVFRARQPMNRALDAQRTQWNRECRHRKDWKYEHTSLFVRDSQQALDRLTGL